MPEEELLYLVYLIHFLGEAKPRPLVIPIPDMLGASTYQEMLEAEDAWLLRRFVDQAAADTPMFGSAWFPDGTPSILTRHELLVRWPERGRAEAREPGAGDQ